MDLFVIVVMQSFDEVLSSFNKMKSLKRSREDYSGSDNVRQAKNPKVLPASAPPRVLPKVKVYGERNSGTNFLQALLLQNCQCEVASPQYEYGWKHGFPDEKHLTKKERKTGVFIIVVRNVSDWLKSTHRRPYHMQPRESFDDFVRQPVRPLESRRDHPVNVDERETNRTIMEIFCDKFRAYNDFFLNNKAVIVNLSFLQEQPKDFLTSLCDSFPAICLKSTFFDPVTLHTKTNEPFQQVDDAKAKASPPSSSSIAAAHPILRAERYERVIKQVDDLTLRINVPPKKMRRPPGDQDDEQPQTKKDS